MNVYIYTTREHVVKNMCVRTSNESMHIYIYTFLTVSVHVV